jgi:putative FmdB family regulatory protein
MPNYDYRCESCGYVFEVFQKMSESRLEICPKCGGKVKRLIGAGMGPIFKGKGFYQTDYKNSNSNASSNASQNKSDSNKSNDKK